MNTGWYVLLAGLAMAAFMGLIHATLSVASVIAQHNPMLGLALGTGAMIIIAGCALGLAWYMYEIWWEDVNR